MTVETVFPGHTHFVASSSQSTMLVVATVQTTASAASLGSTVPFRLADQYGSAMPCQTLGFLTCTGSLSLASAVAGGKGDAT